MFHDVKVIAQLEKKFIIITIQEKAKFIMFVQQLTFLTSCSCAVDQHAADERIRLEKLERDRFNNCVPVENSIGKIKLNQPFGLEKQHYSVIKQHRDILMKWNWEFDFNFMRLSNYEQYVRYGNRLTREIETLCRTIPPFDASKFQNF